MRVNTMRNRMSGVRFLSDPPAPPPPGPLPGERDPDLPPPIEEPPGPIPIPPELPPVPERMAAGRSR